MNQVWAFRLFVFLLVMCIDGSVLSAQQRFSAPGLTNARRLIESRQRKIMFAMHPTVADKDAISLEYLGCEVEGANVSYKYKFRFKGFDGKQSATMKFTFHNNGLFRSIETVDYTSQLVAPFTAADLVIDLLRDMVKEDAKLKDDALMTKRVF
ncbi:hypothetical protein [Mariniblastus fucicola]|uniref:Uncharacterized protein n=1 Tax=Mariniblastus fucicola TaxID=980251 RepID=A0A5B9P7T1_9BACT|nr:hypothetical protein [Mariniblastus fucicola]QEG21002.1 hypothetical protein MFFC18_08540 [Mariniblastus fucicola]